MIRLGIRVRAADAELALARLLPVLGAGAEERAAGDAIEYALYGPAGELPSERDLRALAGDALLGVAIEAVPDGWERAWHAHVPRVTVGALSVRPPWVAGEPSDLVIDPGLAFGAGTHATTRLCLELLQELPPAGGLCDWGTGTGVLALAAARLGFTPVTAIENDPEAVALARENAARAVASAGEVTVLAGDVTLEPPPWAPTVVANLTLSLLRAAAAAPGRTPQTLVMSGVITGQAEEAVRAWEARGLAEAERRELEGWAAVVVRA